MGHGGRLWLYLIGGAIGLWFGGILLFLLFEGALYRWGFLGVFLVIGAILILFGLWYDRRHPKRDDYFEPGRDPLETTRDRLV